MNEFKAELRSLAAGSLPHADPADACQLVLDNLDIPTWPQWSLLLSTPVDILKWGDSRKHRACCSWPKGCTATTCWPSP